MFLVMTAKPVPVNDSSLSPEALQEGRTLRSRDLEF
jgi:hypothetical protein